MSNFSSKNFVSTVWKWSEWGGENRKLAVIGREVWNSLCYCSIKFTACGCHNGKPKRLLIQSC